MSQTRRLWEMLKDGRACRTDHILQVVYGSEHLGIARISARILDVKKQFQVNIKSWQDPVKQSLTWYQVVPKIIDTPFQYTQPLPEKLRADQPQLFTIRDHEV